MSVKLICKIGSEELLLYCSFWFLMFDMMLRLIAKRFLLDWIDGKRTRGWPFDTQAHLAWALDGGRKSDTLLPSPYLIAHIFFFSFPSPLSRPPLFSPFLFVLASCLCTCIAYLLVGLFCPVLRDAFLAYRREAFIASVQSFLVLYFATLLGLIWKLSLPSSLFPQEGARLKQK